MFDLIRRTPKRLWLAAFKPKCSVVTIRYLSQKAAVVRSPRHNDALAEALAPKETEFKHISFTFAIISLSAKLATAGGDMTRESYIAFRDAFPLSGGLCGKLRKLFVMACDDPTPMEHYVSQIRHIFPRNQPLFKALVARMFAIAAASPPLNREQEHFMARLAHMLGITPAEFSRLHEQYTAPKPHHILGTQRRPTREQLKKRYYQLMQRYHPDRYASEDISPELEQLLSLRTGEISTAYKILSRKAA